MAGFHHVNKQKIHKKTLSTPHTKQEFIAYRQLKKNNTWTKPNAKLGEKI